MYRDECEVKYNGAGSYIAAMKPESAVCSDNVKKRVR